MEIIVTRPREIAFVLWGHCQILLADPRTIYLAKTKALISCAVTAQRICGFVLAYAKSRFSQDTTHFKTIFLVSGQSIQTDQKHV